MFSLVHSQKLTDRHVRNYTLGFLSIAGLYLLSGLNYPLLNVTETRAAEVAREILVLDDWTTLHLNFEAYHHKPPLFYWLCAASFSVFGVNEFAARLVSSLASWGSIVLTVWFASHWFNRRVGLLSGFVLFFSAGFFGLSRFLVCDPLFSFFCNATALTGYEAIRAAMDPTQPLRGRIWMGVCGFCCGLGVLTKGPVILALCGVPFLIAIFFLHRQSSMNWIAVGWAVITGGIVVAPWLIWTASVNPDYLAEFFILHNAQRFLGRFHDEPFWYFLPIFIIAAHPWSSLALPFLHRLWQRRPFHECSTSTFAYLFVTGVWCILFFSISRGKLPTYILPAAAPLSITMAIFLFDLYSRPVNSRIDTIARVQSPIIAIVGTIIAVNAYLVFTPVPWLPEYRLAGIFGINLAFFICLLGICLIRWRSRNPWWIGSIGMVLSLSIWINFCVLPNAGETSTCLGTADSHKTRELVSQASPLVVVEKPFYDVMFYAQRSACLICKKYDKQTLDAQLRRFQKIILIAPPSFSLESLVREGNASPSSRQLSNIVIRRLASHARFVLYQVERGDVPKPLAARK